jgi:hypothetical protein
VGEVVLVLAFAVYVLFLAVRASDAVAAGARRRRVDRALVDEIVGAVPGAVRAGEAAELRIDNLRIEARFEYEDNVYRRAEVRAEPGVQAEFSLRYPGRGVPPEPPVVLGTFSLRGDVTEERLRALLDDECRAAIASLQAGAHIFVAPSAIQIDYECEWPDPFAVAALMRAAKSMQLRARELGWLAG